MTSAAHVSHQRVPSASRRPHMQHEQAYVGGMAPAGAARDPSEEAPPSDQTDRPITPALTSLTASTEDQHQARYSYFPCASAPRPASGGASAPLPYGARGETPQIMLSRGSRRVR